MVSQVKLKIATAIFIASACWSPAVAAPAAKAPSPETQRKIDELREEGKQKGWTFDIAYNDAVDRPLSQLAASVAPADFAQNIDKWNQQSEKMLQIEQQRVKESAKSAPKSARKIGAVFCTITAPTCDYQPKMTAIKNQGGCGSCWDFAAMGAWEGNYALRYSTKFDTSEQHVLNCSNGGTCGGGWYMPVFAWMLNQKVRDESQQSYTGAVGTCTTMPNGKHRVAAYGYVASVAKPTVTQIKQALVTHGPLVVTINATAAFQALTGSGVFNQGANPTDANGNPIINHGVDIVGWDDAKSAWRVRNSWGTSWGDGGYAWVAYGSNHIGAYAAWVHPVDETIVPWDPIDVSTLIDPGKFKD